MSDPVRRRTRQGVIIANYMAKHPRFRSAQDVHTALREAGHSIGLATCYRALQRLADDGEVDVIHDDTNGALYRWCELKGHHHHVRCVSCGRAEELVDLEVEHRLAAAARNLGFKNVQHDLELRGVCDSCE